MNQIPLPLEAFDGGIVVASTWLNDDDPEASNALLVILDHTPGEHYRIVEIQTSRNGWRILWRQHFPNIVPAVEAYVANGGDY
jgi:hypothetical protein